jgi:hypothetical protein
LFPTSGWYSHGFTAANCTSAGHSWTVDGCFYSEEEPGAWDEPFCQSWNATYGSIWTAGSCSDSFYGTKASCIAARESWTAGVCSDDFYGNEDDCIAVGTWTPASCSDPFYGDSSSCTTPGIWTPASCSDTYYGDEFSCTNPGAWTPAVCSDTHYGDEFNCTNPKIWTPGVCSDPSFTDAASCAAANEIWTTDVCSISSWWFTNGFTEEDCTSSGKNNATWIAASCSDRRYGDADSCINSTGTWGFCSNTDYSIEADCIAAREIWTPEFCSNLAYDNEDDCITIPEVWTPGFCSNDAYSNEAACIAAHETWILDACSNDAYGDVDSCLAARETWTRSTSLGNSFYGDFIAVDYDLSFQVESLYFGSVYDADTSNHSSHKGALHRLVINDNPDPTTWIPNIFYDVESPVTAAPSVATDGSRAWIYFGTGRFFSAKEDKAILATTPPTQFLGLKENYNSDGEMNLSSPNAGRVVDVTDVWVENDGLGTLAPLPILDNAGDNLTGVDTFAKLRNAMDKKVSDVDFYHGWKIELAAGERVIGQPAILGDIVTFTSYIPSNDPCEPDGNSYLWAPYFRTGTAFYRSVIGTDETDGEILRKVDLGAGLSTTPNIHTGAGDGSKAFVQSSTGAILSIEQTNPGVVKSGMRSWRELNGSCNSGD